MAKFEVDTPLVTIRAHDDNSTFDDLRKAAMDSFKEATEIVQGTDKPHGAVGFFAERREQGTRGYGTKWDQPRPTQQAEVTE